MGKPVIAGTRITVEMRGAAARLHAWFEPPDDRPQSAAENRLRVRVHLKAELKKKGIGYKQLAEKLEEIGIHETDRNIANKLARGDFSAVFMAQVLTAIGCQTLHLDA